MNEQYANWNKDYFIAFLMIHLANADLKVSQEEMIMIMDSVSEDTYRKVKKVWDNCNDFTCLQIIRNLREKFFPGQEGKEELINGMIDFVKADDEVSTNEKILIAAMNKLL